MRILKLTTLITACLAAVPVFADTITIHDAYARSSGPSAKTGAAFFEIVNKGDRADRLVAAESDIAVRTELHTHIEADNGVMQMREVEGGFEIPAGGSHLLQRGADHVMFMGLNQGLAHGDTVTLTLIFEEAGPITLDVPVDLERQPDSATHGHSN